MGMALVSFLTSVYISYAYHLLFLSFRPPGHHAEESKCMGFSHLNSVAIAARYAIDRLGLQR